MIRVCSLSLRLQVWLRKLSTTLESGRRLAICIILRMRDGVTKRWTIDTVGCENLFHVELGEGLQSESQAEITGMHDFSFPSSSKSTARSSLRPLSRSDRDGLFTMVVL